MRVAAQGARAATGRASHARRTAPEAVRAGPAGRDSGFRGGQPQAGSIRRPIRAL